MSGQQLPGTRYRDNSRHSPIHPTSSRQPFTTTSPFLPLHITSGVPLQRTLGQITIPLNSSWQPVQSCSTSNVPTTRSRTRWRTRSVTRTRPDASPFARHVPRPPDSGLACVINYTPSHECAFVFPFKFLYPATRCQFLGHNVLIFVTQFVTSEVAGNLPRNSGGGSQRHSWAFT